MDEAAVGIEADPPDATLDSQVSHLDWWHSFDIDISGLSAKMIGPTVTATSLGPIPRHHHDGLTEMTADQRQMTSQARVDVMGLPRTAATHQGAEQMELRGEEVASRTDTEELKLLGVVVSSKSDRRRLATRLDNEDRNKHQRQDLEHISGHVG